MKKKIINIIGVKKELVKNLNRKQIAKILDFVKEQIESIEPHSVTISDRTIGIDVDDEVAKFIKLNTHMCLGLDDEDNIPMKTVLLGISYYINSFKEYTHKHQNDDGVNIFVDIDILVDINSNPRAEKILSDITIDAIAYKIMLPDEVLQ